MVAICPSVWHIWQKGSVRLSFKEFLLDVLDRTVNASWYRSVGCSPDEASFWADMEANSRNTSRRSRQFSDEEIKTRIEESRKEVMTKQWPRLPNANASYAKADLWFVKGRKSSSGSPALSRRSPLTCLSSVGMHIYPPYGFGLFYSHRIYSHRIKEVRSEKAGFFDKAAQQKREDDLSSRFQHIDLLISSYISRVPRWKVPSPCRSRCGQSFRGA